MKAFKIVCLVMYIITALMILVFSCFDGNLSSDQSNGVTAFIIKCLPFIEDSETTRNVIRKLIGHFGLFLFMGIFSTLTYFLYLAKKSNLAIVVNVGQAVCIAAITEIIQLFVPQRAGDFIDVCIDLGGFFTSMIIVSIIYIVVTVNKLSKEQ